LQHFASPLLLIFFLPQRTAKKKLCGTLHLLCEHLRLLSGTLRLKMLIIKTATNSTKADKFTSRGWARILKLERRKLVILGALEPQW